MILDFPGDRPGTSNEEKAQDMVYDAWDSNSPVQRKRLARKAIELDPFCADAYCVLAEEYESVEKRRECFTKGIAVFKEKYGKKYFKENTGYFWGLIETRPYMRLCAGYGELLWETGEKEAAIAQYEELLQLNPNDNQGLRYNLLNWLLATGNLDKAGELLKNHDEGSAFILFNRLLFIIKMEPSNTKKIADAYRKANRENPFVTQYLLGNKTLPDSEPEYCGIGDENEALTYCFGAKRIWQEDEAAMAILGELV
jgi:tetratricopeptide (TPR) repeat protein